MTDHPRVSPNEPAVLPCPFCGAPAQEYMWPKHYGCSDKACGAHAANLTAEQWNRRPVSSETTDWQALAKQRRRLLNMAAGVLSAVVVVTRTPTAAQILGEIDGHLSSTPGPDSASKPKAHKYATAGDCHICGGQPADLIHT